MIALYGNNIPLSLNDHFSLQLNNPIIMQPSNTIVERVKAFLAPYPPFRFLPADALHKLSASVRIDYVTEGKLVFQEATEPHPYFYMLKEGSVALFQQDQLLEACDEGDVFGVRAMISGKPYLATAKALEESLVYAIPIQVFKPYLEDYPQVAMYFAAGFAAGQAVVREDAAAAQQATARPSMNLAHRQLRPSRQAKLHRLEDTFVLDGYKAIHSCPPDETIQSLATRMAKLNIGSILVVEAGLPVGIITDTDFRKKVATGILPVFATASELMSHPVACVQRHRTVATLIMKMMKQGIHHLCITEDGTRQTPAIGLISQHDLLLAQGRNPGALMRAIRKSQDVGSLPRIRNHAEELLEQYLEQHVAMEFVSEVITTLNDSLIEKALQASEQALENEGLGLPPVKYTWLSLGSEGREEQLLRTDQDNALLYDNPPQGKEAATQAYFLELGKRVVQILIDCGFIACPAEMMARNPQWCQPLNAWKGYFREWISKPDEDALMRCNIFFDFRAVHGDRNLAQNLSQEVRTAVKEHGTFLNFLAKSAIKHPPPLGFFKQLLVEKDGKHKKAFDLKLRGMMPLADAARLLILHYEVEDPHHTAQRFRAVAHIDTKNSGLYEEAAQAYEVFMRLRAKEGLKQHNSGRYIQPQNLSKLEMQVLRQAFRTIKDLQQVLEVKFQLSYFG